jgi:multicomponent Na+:H+ antiporter subunit A
MNESVSLILDTLAGAIVRLALLFSLFLLFSGHNAPGGGFVGGLVASVALVVSYVSKDPDIIRRVSGITPVSVLGTGLMVATLTGIGGWVWGGSFLESTKLEFELPLFGQIAVTSALPFDIGVYLVVYGLAAAVVDSLGRLAPELDE